MLNYEKYHNILDSSIFVYLKTRQTQFFNLFSQIFLNIIKYNYIILLFIDILVRIYHTYWHYKIRS